MSGDFKIQLFDNTAQLSFAKCDNILLEIYF